MKKQKRWMLILSVIILAAIFMGVSCGLFPSLPDILKGSGMWSKSRYGEAPFGEQQGTIKSMKTLEQ